MSKSTVSPVEQIERLKGALAVAQAKAAMYERWLRTNHAECPLLAENIVEPLYIDGGENAV